MSDIDVETIPCIPENPALRLRSTGSCGGDASHGGHTDLTFIAPSTKAALTYEDPTGRTVQVDRIVSATVKIRGDWEFGGMMAAIDELHEGVMAIPEAREQATFWRTGSYYGVISDWASEFLGSMPGARHLDLTNAGLALAERLKVNRDKESNLK